MAAREALRRRNLLPLDLAALGLAAASLVLLIAYRSVDLNPDEVAWLRWVDYAAILVFALFAAAKLLTAPSPVHWARGHWFDVIGLLPVTKPLLGLDRWWTLVAIVIVLARASVALDRAFGERVLMRVWGRYRAALVEELTEPILMRLLAIIRAALTEGRYMESVGKSVEEKRGDIHEMVRKAVDASPKLSFLRAIPGMETKLNEAVDEAVTAAVVALTSEEMNRIVRDAIERALKDLEAEVAKPTWKKEGLTLGDIARGLTRG